MLTHVPAVEPVRRRMGQLAPVASLVGVASPRPGPPLLAHPRGSSPEGRPADFLRRATSPAPSPGPARLAGPQRPPGGAGGAPARRARPRASSRDARLPAASALATTRAFLAHHHRQHRPLVGLLGTSSGSSPPSTAWASCTTQSAGNPQVMTSIARRWSRPPSHPGGGARVSPTTSSAPTCRGACASRGADAGGAGKRRRPRAGRPRRGFRS